MRTSRTNTRRRNDSQGAATNPAAAAIAMSDAHGSQPQPPHDHDHCPQPPSAADAAAAAAATNTSTSGRPRRSAATQAQLKLMQQRFEAEHAPVSRQPSNPNAAAAAHPPRRHGRPPTRAAATIKRATTGKRVRVSCSSSSEPDSDVEEEDDGGGPVRGERSRSAAAKAPVRKKVKYAGSTDSEDSEGEEESDELAARVTRRKNRATATADDESVSDGDSGSGGSDEDAHSSDSESEQSGEEQEEEEAQEEEEEESPKQDEEEAVSSEEEEAESSSEEEEDEEEDGDTWLPGSESAAAAAPKRAARRKAVKAKTKVKAKAKTQSKAKAKSKSKAAEESSAGAAASVGSVPSIMNLLDQQDDQAAVDVMRLTLQSDNDDSLAALLCSRSNADGQVITEQSQGSTFLQRFYRVHCAFHTPGFADHRPRLMRLIELHGSFHATSRNHVGQTLLHTICMTSTYSVTHRTKNRRYSSGPEDVPEFSEWTTSNNRAQSFTSSLLEMLIRKGADFQQPDDNGAIPLFELVKTVRAGLIVTDLIEDLLLPPTQVKPKFKGGVPLRPLDLTLVDCCANTVFTLLFGDWKERQHRFWTFVNLLIQHARDIANADLFARSIHGDCALSLIAKAVRKIKALPSQAKWTKEYNDKQKKLPQKLLQAWQAARTPAVRKELDVWMIPVLADICCEYVMGPAQKVGHKMSKQEKESVFGLEPRAQPSPSPVKIENKVHDGSLRLPVPPFSTAAATAVTASSALRIAGRAGFNSWSPMRVMQKPLSLLFREAATTAAAAEGDADRDEQLDGEGDAEGDAVSESGADVEVAEDLDGQDGEAAASTSASPVPMPLPAMDDHDDGPTDMEF